MSSDVVTKMSQAKISMGEQIPKRNLLLLEPPVRISIWQKRELSEVSFSPLLTRARGSEAREREDFT